MSKILGIQSLPNSFTCSYMPSLPSSISRYSKAGYSQTQKQVPFVLSAGHAQGESASGANVPDLNAQNVELLALVAERLVAKGRARAADALFKNVVQP